MVISKSDFRKDSHSSTSSRCHPGREASEPRHLKHIGISTCVKNMRSGRSQRDWQISARFRTNLRWDYKKASLEQERQTCSTLLKKYSWKGGMSQIVLIIDIDRSWFGFDTRTGDDAMKDNAWHAETVWMTSGDSVRPLREKNNRIVQKWTQTAN